MHNFSGHEAIINTLSVNADGVLFSGGEWPSLFPSIAAFNLK